MAPSWWHIAPPGNAHNATADAGKNRSQYRTMIIPFPHMRKANEPPGQDRVPATSRAPQA
ncbi:hypothetical protein BN77_2833 [Rhizobium mesoamericanum STM3625]|uniref:Uncharacterized protein n=1 Tax=Rhizobium mesoamericanum STM3625 TaxID=1211777 RepID=K0PP97_9HYPH|nr:hypothetical protein BN77_2833 [Rhizobium mesoamericanum STM3625]